MPIRVGQRTEDPPRIYIGDTRIERAFQGEAVIWNPAPETPPNLTAAATGLSVSGSYDAVFGADDYNVRYATSNNGPWTELDRDTLLTYAFTGLYSTRYWVQVNAENYGNASPWSASVQVVTGDRPPTPVPVIPPVPSATVWVQSREVWIRFRPTFPAATSYGYRYREGTSGQWTVGAFLAGADRNFVVPNANTTYQLEFSAMNAQGRSAYGRRRTITVRAQLAAQAIDVFPNGERIRLALDESTRTATRISGSLSWLDTPSRTFPPPGDATSWQVETRRGATASAALAAFYGSRISTFTTSTGNLPFAIGSYYQFRVRSLRTGWSPSFWRSSNPILVS